MDYVERFRKTVAELEARPDVAVTRLWVGAPVSDEAIAKVQDAIGMMLGEEILGFYRQANGLVLQWFAEGTDGFEAGAKREEARFGETPDDGYQSGVVNIAPLEEMVEDWEEIFWFDHMEDEEPFDFHGTEYEMLAFHKSLRAVDYFDEYRIAALLLAAGGPNPPVVFGDDHGADFQTFPPVSFGNYLETVLAIRGSYRQRVRRFFSDPSGIDLPMPSLDEIVAECKLDEEVWEEQIEAELGDEYDEDE